MKYLLLALSILLLFINCIYIDTPVTKGQNTGYRLIVIKERSKDIEIRVDDKLVNEDKEDDIFSYAAMFNQKGDSILIYNYLNTKISENNNPDKVLATWSKKAASTSQKKLCFFVGDKIVDSIVVSFHKDNLIKVNRDSYYVNAPYYAFLKNQVTNNSSVLGLIGLLKDGLGDYSPYFELFNKPWQLKRQDPGFKIIKAVVSTRDENMPDDSFNRYNVSYEYVNNKLKRIAKIKQGETGQSFAYEKTLSKHPKSGFDVYVVTKNTAKVINTDDVYTNRKNHTDSIKREWLQVGINKQTTSILFQVFRRDITIHGFLWKTEDLKKLVLKTTTRRP